jgi:uncharacterized membrane protein
MTSNVKIWEFISIVLSALVSGMFFGPWVALSRSMGTFKPEVFLPIVDRMNRNMAPVMTLLMPASILSIVPVLLLSWHTQPRSFYAALAGLLCLVVALLVTTVVEVPIVKQIVTWTIATLPGNWQQLRDRWGRFHIVRILAGFAGFVLLVVAAIF